MRPLIAHCLYRLSMGGVETNLVNLVNRAPAGRYRHAIVAVTEADSFRETIRVPGVEIVELHKKSGPDPAWLLRLFSVLRRLRPAIFHSRNLAALEGQFAAAAAGVPGRVHSVEGRDTYDLDGTHRRYNRLRRIARPFVHNYIAVSSELGDWLEQTIHVPGERVQRISNGVDTTEFSPRQGRRPGAGPEGFMDDDSIVIGNVGRAHDVKAPLTLIEAFARARRLLPVEVGDRLRLVWIGDGPLLDECRDRLSALGLHGVSWFPGARGDVAALLRSLDLFAMSSLVEGIPIALLEAMACGLPVVCPRVGGLPELVETGLNGTLTEARSVEGLADAFAFYASDPLERARQGAASRRRAVERYGLDAVIAAYLNLYDATLARRRYSSPEPR